MTKRASSKAPLASALRARMTELGIAGSRLVEGGYISRATLTRIQGGHQAIRNPRGLERGLGWAAGSVSKVADGGEPVEVINSEAVRWPRRDGDWRAAIEDAWDAHVGSVEPGRTVPARCDSEGLDDWLATRTADWPAWLAERLRAVLEDHGDNEDLAALVGRVVPTDRLPDVIRLVAEWQHRTRGA